MALVQIEGESGLFERPLPSEIPSGEHAAKAAHRKMATATTSLAPSRLCLSRVASDLLLLLSPTRLFPLETVGWPQE